MREEMFFFVMGWRKHDYDYSLKFREEEQFRFRGRLVEYHMRKVGVGMA